MKNVEDTSGIMVSIRCLAYNHEPYIRQCLDGFVMQKTNFRFEAIVHDDASTDGTAGIIREYAEKYPDIIKPIYEVENQYSKRGGSLNRIMNEACRGKYIAICEGDDYWIDPLKLQKQVDFLENHPDYALVYTRSKVYNQQKGKMESYVAGKEQKGFDDLLYDNLIPTLTVCFQMDAYRDFLSDVEPHKRNWLMGDYPIWLWMSWHYKIKFLDEETGVYRILPESASHSANAAKQEAFKLSVIDIKRFFVEKFKLGSLDVYRRSVNYYYYLIFLEYWQVRNIQKMEEYYYKTDGRYLSFVHRKKLFERFWKRKMAGLLFRNKVRY